MPTSSHVSRGRATNTFVVRVLPTNDQGWSGVITHVQSGRTRNFKGFIEAVRFMDSFVGGEAGVHDDAAPGGELTPDVGGKEGRL